MNQFDTLLRMYADNGLRTVEDWFSRGRDIEAGVKARVDMPHRGVIMPLYSRDQTQPHKSSGRKQPEPQMAGSED